MRFAKSLLLASFVASTLALGCAGETAPLDVRPHAIALVSDQGSGPTAFVLMFDVPVTCDDARFLEKGAPPGARFKAVASTREWKVGALSPDRAALFDDGGLLANRVLTETWGEIDLLTAPTVKGATARLRASGRGTFSIRPRRPFSEDGSESVIYFGEPDTQEFTLSGEIDATLCTDVVVKK